MNYIHHETKAALHLDLDIDTTMEHESVHKLIIRYMASFTPPSMLAALFLLSHSFGRGT